MEELIIKSRGYLIQMIKITYMVLGIISLIAVVGTVSMSSHAFAQSTDNLTSSILTTKPSSTTSNGLGTSALQTDVQSLASTATAQAQQLQSQAQSLQSQAQSLQNNAQSLGNSVQSQTTPQLNSQPTQSGVQTPSSGNLFSGQGQ